jgi:hypothetical protein
MFKEIRFFQKNRISHRLIRYPPNTIPLRLFLCLIKNGSPSVQHRVGSRKERRLIIGGFSFADLRFAVALPTRLPRLLG